MDYSERAKLNLDDNSGAQMDSEVATTMQAVALQSIASTFVAITEHLTALDTGAAMRREIDKLAIRFNELESKLAGVIVQHVNDYAEIDRRLDTIEFERKCQVGKDATKIRQRLDEIDATARRLINRVSDLEELPGVVDIIKGGEVVERIRGGHERGVYDGPPVEAQPALWEKLENARADVERLKRQAIRDDERHVESHRYAKRLEDRLNELREKLETSRRIIDEILQAVNDSDLSREEMIKEVDKAFS